MTVTSAFTAQLSPSCPFPVRLVDTGMPRVCGLRYDVLTCTRLYAFELPVALLLVVCVPVTRAGCIVVVRTICSVAACVVVTAYGIVTPSRMRIDCAALPCFRRVAMFSPRCHVFAALPCFRLITIISEELPIVHIAFSPTFSFPFQLVRCRRVLTSARLVTTVR
jgi:hypothetical protein